MEFIYSMLQLAAIAIVFFLVWHGSVVVISIIESLLLHLLNLIEKVVNKHK